MPPRWVCLVILLFWLGFNGWLFFSDLLPRLLPHQPPPYTIDLTEEAKLRRPYIDWIVLCDDQKVFRAQTEVKHLGHEDVTLHDVFEMTAKFKPFEPNKKPVAIHGFMVSQMSSAYRVNAAGDLLGLSVNIVGQPDVAEMVVPILQLLGLRPSRRTDLQLDIDGEVASSRLVSRARFALPDGKSYQLSLPEVSVSRGGSVLLPLHPVNRIRGLRPGQSWTQRVLDPLGDSLRALQGSDTDLRYLRASIRPEPTTFSYGRRLDVPCLVIDYTGDDFTGSTWVALDRGLVLCQEAHIEGRRWVMNRD